MSDLVERLRARAQQKTPGHYDRDLLYEAAVALASVPERDAPKSRAYVESYEGTHPDDPPPPGYYATCGECDWEGAHRDEYAEAAKDAAAHVCPVPERDTLREGELEKLRAAASAAWGYRVFYEGYWGEDIPGSPLPREQKERLLATLVGWQKELDAALAALDDKPGDFEAAKQAHRATFARALAAPVEPREEQA